LLGWDTDQFPTDYYLTTQVMLVLLKYGLAPGGVNFDAKVRRESFDPVDLFYAHIGGMDAFARGLKVAAAIRADGVLDKMLSERYRSWDCDLGRKIEAGSVGFRDLENIVMLQGDVAPNQSGRQELIENIVNRYFDLA
jgi:xylose isomerase